MPILQLRKLRPSEVNCSRLQGLKVMGLGSKTRLAGTRDHVAELEIRSSSSDSCPVP